MLVQPSSLTSQEKSKADAIEQAAIEEARRELLARSEYTAASAAAVIRVGIRDRVQMLNDAQSHWLENYRRSLEEWSVRNQACSAYTSYVTIIPLSNPLP